MNTLKFLMPLLVSVAISAPVAAVAANAASLNYQTYIDGAYLDSNHDPEDDNWVGKSSSATLNELTLNLAMFNISREVTTESRWGFEFGLQTGDDSERLVPSAPPAANEPFSNADELRHFYRANASVLLGEEGQLKLTGGLINSYIGYESYLAIDNFNYTRAYLSDTVPYLLFGAEAMWDVNDAVGLGFYVVNGYNYLADPNDLPSFGFSGKFGLTENVNFVQNLYYGSDQKNTDLEFWRFFTNSIMEWSRGSFTLAASLDYGTEKQADVIGQPRYQWTTGAAWFNWAATKRLSLAFRPEFHIDTDGIATGAERKVQAYTGTLKYQVLPRNNRIVGTLELRHDKSRGTGGGFPDDLDEPLQDSQSLLIASLIWQFKK